MKIILQDRKPDEPLVLANRDAEEEEAGDDVELAQPHVFTPEDDFVPFGHPADVAPIVGCFKASNEFLLDQSNIFKEPVTENPSVALAEEDIIIVNQGPVNVKDLNKTDIEMDMNNEEEAVEV